MTADFFRQKLSSRLALHKPGAYLQLQQVAEHSTLRARETLFGQNKEATSATCIFTARLVDKLGKAVCAENSPLQTNDRDTRLWRSSSLSCFRMTFLLQWKVKNSGNQKRLWGRWKLMHVINHTIITKFRKVETCSQFVLSSVLKSALLSEPCRLESVARAQAQVVSKRQGSKPQKAKPTSKLSLVESGVSVVCFAAYLDNFSASFNSSSNYKLQSTNWEPVSTFLNFVIKATCNKFLVCATCRSFSPKIHET